MSRQTYEPADTDFTAQIQVLKDSGANAMVVANTSAVTAQLVVGLSRPSGAASNDLSRGFHGSGS